MRDRPITLLIILIVILTAIYLAHRKPASAAGAPAAAPPSAGGSGNSGKVVPLLPDQVHPAPVSLPTMQPLPGVSADGTTGPSLVSP